MGARDVWQITYTAGDQEWVTKVYTADDVARVIAQHQADGAPTKRSRALVEADRDAAIIKAAAEGVEEWVLARRHGLTAGAVSRIIADAKRAQRAAARPRFVEETDRPGVRRTYLRRPTSVRFE